MLHDKLKTIKGYENDIDNFYLSVNQKILSYMVLDLVESEILADKVDLKFVIDKTQTFKSNLKTIAKEITTQEADYKKFVAKKEFQDIIKSNEEIKAADQVLNEAFFTASPAADTLTKAISQDKVMSLLNLLVVKKNAGINISAITKINGTTYMSLPMQLNGDESILKIAITPQKAEYGLQSYQTEIKFPQKKQFYVGLGMSFYGAPFKNDSYSVSATVIDSTRTDYKIVNEKNKKGELSITTLLHFGVRPFLKQDWFSLNLVVGPALSLTEIIKPRIALGGGFCFGTKEMLSINFLALGGYVDRKSAVYDTDTAYNSKPENITVSKLSWVGGVSLGYIYNFNNIFVRYYFTINPPLLLSKTIFGSLKRRLSTLLAIRFCGVSCITSSGVITIMLSLSCRARSRSWVE